LQERAFRDNGAGLIDLREVNKTTVETITNAAAGAWRTKPIFEAAQAAKGAGTVHANSRVIRENGCEVGL
jgi:hypothetical protein